MNDKDKTKAQLIAELEAFRLRHEQCQHNLKNIFQTQRILNDVIDKNPISIQIVDKDGYSVQENAAHISLFKAKPGGKFCLFTDTQLLKLGFSKYFERLKQGNAVFFPDHKYNAHLIDPKYPDAEVCLTAVAFPIFDEQNQPERYVIMHANITDRKKAEDEKRIMNQQLRLLIAHNLKTKEQERKQIAGEIHDQLGHTLSAIQIDLQLLSHAKADNVKKPMFEKISAGIDQALQTIQQMLSDLVPIEFEGFGFETAMENAATEFIEQNKIKVELSIQIKQNLPNEISNNLFQIWKEALTNVIRHAKANTITAKLWQDNVFLYFEISDDGRGITPQQIKAPHSYGIMGMKSRTLTMEGAFSIQSKPKSGTIINIVIPLPK